MPDVTRSVMYQVRVVATPVLSTGLRLAGLPVEEASTPAQAGIALDRLIAAGDTGVILVEQSLFAALPEQIHRGIERRPLPIVIPIPSASWVARGRGGEDYILDLLQRAIGYRVRLG